MKMSGIASIHIIALFIVAIIIVGGVAIYATSVPPGEKEVVRWWIQSTSPYDIEFYNGWAEKIEGELPGIDLQMDYASSEDLRTKFYTAILGGEPPELYDATSGYARLKEYVDGGYILCLDNFVADRPWLQEQLTPASVVPCSFYGRLWGIPNYVWSGHFYINPELFEEAGVPVPEKSWTFDEFINACEKLKNHGIIPNALSYEGDAWELDFYYMYLVDRIGGSEVLRRTLNREEGYSFEDPAFVEAGYKLLEIMPYFNEGWMGTDGDTAAALFHEGKAAMFLQGTWDIWRQLDYPELDVKLVPFPTVAGGVGDPTMLLGGSQQVWIVSQYANNVEGALKVLEHLCKPESQIYFFEEQIVTLAQDIEIPPEVMENAPELLVNASDFVAEASFIQVAWDEYCPPLFAAGHKEAVLDMVNGLMTPEEMGHAFEEMAKELEAAGKLPDSLYEVD